MLWNSLKIAFRQIRKNRLYAAINISGLTLGIASCLLIGVYILHEFSFDRFHTNVRRIVRVTMDYNAGDAISKVVTTGTKVGPQFKRTFPEVEAYARTLKYTRVVKYEDHVFLIPGFNRDHYSGSNCVVRHEQMVTGFFLQD